jgi:hypothetical protein
MEKLRICQRQEKTSNKRESNQPPAKLQLNINKDEEKKMAKKERTSFNEI